MTTSSMTRTTWLVAGVVLCAAAGNVWGADATPAVLTIDWQARAAEGLVANGEAVDLAERRPFTAAHALKVVSPAKTSEQPTVVPLTVIDQPPLTQQTFALRGWIKHSGVQGTGFLEMWAVFPDGSRYFSRTLANAGPMRSLHGDADWREIVLPFQLLDDGPKPKQLLVNAVFAGAGELTLSDLTLTEADNLAAAITPGAWWSDSVGGWIGAVVGCVLGLFGAVVGVLSSRGIGRPFVSAALLAGTAIGGVLLVLGVVAVTTGQPYVVYYPLLLGGGLCAVLCLTGYTTHRQRNAQLELRRMQALDA